MRDFLYPIRVIHGKLHDYQQERKRLIVIERRIQTTDSNTILFVFTPTHGNLGDHAIALAVSVMLNELNIAYVEITADELRLMKKHNKMHIMNGHPILVNGGGNIGTLWISAEELFRSIIQNCPKSKILCLPNTAYFEGSKQGMYEYVRSKKIYQAHDALMICARERVSYEFLKKMHSNVVLIPDMVFSLNECKAGPERKGCLLCLRSDRERTRDENADRIIMDQVTQLFPNDVFFSDMNIGKSVSVEHRENELDRKFETFRTAKLVITDRLHGMIFAAITGTPCIVINSKSPKVRGCYEWIKELGYIRFVEDPSEITEVYNLMNTATCTYSNEHLQQYYQELKHYLLSMVK